MIVPVVIICLVIVAAFSVAELATVTPQEEQGTAFFDTLFPEEQDDIIGQMGNAEPFEPVYLASRSNMYANVWMTGRDEFQMMVSPDIINYYDNGELKPIRKRFVPATDGAYDWESTENVFQVYLKDDVTSANSISVATDTYGLSFTLDALSYRNCAGGFQAIGHPSADTISSPVNTATGTMDYNNVFGSGTNLFYTVRNSQLKQGLMIDSIDSIQKPEMRMYANCTDPCINTGITLDLDYKFEYDTRLDVVVNGRAWNGRQEETWGSIIFRDKRTGHDVFIIEPAFTVGNWSIEKGKYILNYSNGENYIIHQTPYNFTQIPSNYPIIIDPTTDLNYSKAVAYTEVISCSPDATCCGLVGGLCSASAGSVCGISGLGFALEKFTYSGNGCYACGPVVPCCTFNGNAGNYEYREFNLSQGINNSFNAVNITYAGLNVSVTLPATGKTVNVSHVDNNASQCNIYTPSHTMDSAFNKMQQAGNYIMAFDVTDHVQGNIDNNNESVWFQLYSDDNLASTRNIINETILNITFTVNSCEIFRGKNTEIDCSDNCTFTYIHNGDTFNISFIGNGNTTFNNLTVNSTMLNLSTTSTACDINLINYTNGGWRTES